MPQLTKQRRSKIATLHAQGTSIAKIARTVGCSRPTVRRWVARSKGPLGVQRMPRKLVVGEAAASRALQLLKSGAQGGARFVASKLKQEALVVRAPSRKTVVRAAKQAAEAAGRPVEYKRGRPKPGLSQANKNRRLQFCDANMNRKWRKVMFTDRCKFSFRYPCTPVRRGRWVAQGERDDTGVYTPTHPQVYNVYGGITVHGTTKLFPVTGTSGLKTNYVTKQGQQSRNITADEYKVVVKELFLPNGEGIFSRAGTRNWVLQQDGDPTHRAANHTVKEYNRLGLSHVEILPNWPGNSPDLSPIENVWAIVDAQVAELGCKSFQELKRAVDRTFQNIPKSTLVNLFNSMPKRLQECVEKGGGKTRY